MERIVVYCGTRNLYEQMETSLKSLIVNTKVDQVYLMIEDKKFPRRLPKYVKVMDVSDQTYFPHDGINAGKRFTYMALMRSALAKYFPQYDVVLALDCDTIIVDDISGIWDIDVSDVYFSASKEEANSKDGYLYANTGVTLYNLKKIREDGIDDKAIHMVNTVDLRCPEQDALNFLCRGHIHDMPGMYNATRYTEQTSSPKIIHYSGYVDWQKFPEYLEYKNLTMKEAESGRTKSLRTWIETTYMIHTCKEREWYVNDYLIPSMTAQGILKERILIWKDEKQVGNLRSFVDSMRWISETQGHLGGIWHLQDDIIIGSHFAEITAKNDKGLVCGFCNEKFDGGNVNFVGIVPVAYTWFSFPCIRIPNLYAGEFVEWYEKDVVPNGKYTEYTSESKHDDALFRFFLVECHPNDTVYNLLTNLVDHVDYLIGGSVVNKQRDGIRKAYRFEEPELVDALEKALCRKSKKPSKR